jgi:hypothetical protein
MGLLMMRSNTIIKSTIPLGASTIPLRPSHDVLLQTRMCDLDVSLRHSPLQPLVELFFKELTARGLKKLRPAVYLGDEWFSPRGVVAIAIPFYLADPRLIDLERGMMTRVEGETKDWFLRLIRHEAGHCFDHAYGLSKTRQWQELFGDPNLPYDPDNYNSLPFSRKYVKNLAENYAQSHPIEDFAETFAVWMRGPDYWRQRYDLRPIVLEKLCYIEAMAKKYSNRKPFATEKSRMCSARRLRITLQTYYDRRIAAEGVKHGKAADQKLQKIFQTPRPHTEPLSPWLTSNRESVIDRAAKAARGRKYEAKAIYSVLGNRSQQMGLTIDPKNRQVKGALVRLVTELMTANSAITIKPRKNTEAELC